MTKEDRYSNSRHERPTPSARFCSLCDAVVNKDISENSYDKQLTGVSWS